MWLFKCRPKLFVFTFTKMLKIDKLFVKMYKKNGNFNRKIFGFFV